MKRFILLAALVFTITALTACSGASAPDMEEQPIPDTGEPTSEMTEVNISGFAYDPAAISVPVGTTVMWTNNNSVPHTVTSDDGLWDSGNLNPGSTFSYTFEQPGTFAYHCEIHPTMTGTVEVTE